MTLLITSFAAIIATVLWYQYDHEDSKLGTLALMYWGASIMWFVDAVAEYFQLGAEFFTPATKNMINDSYLGFSVVALGLIIWLVILFIKDPKGIIRDKLLNKRI